MSNQRWSKFWWQDWQRDQALAMCSLSAQGLWMRLLCIAHDGDPYGHVTVNGRSPTIRQIGLMARVSEKDATALIAELEDAGVFSRTSEGIIFSRRMVKDKAISEQASAYGKDGGNPALKGKRAKRVNGGGKPGPLTPPFIPEAEAEAEAEAEDPPSEGSGARARATRLPEKWHPNTECCQFATDLGLDPTAVAARFRDYWQARPGKAGLSESWPATWRNWCREDAARLGKSASQPNGEDRPKYNHLAECLAAYRDGKRPASLCRIMLQSDFAALQEFERAIGEAVH